MSEYDGYNFYGNKGAGILVIAKKSEKFLVAMRSEHVNEPNTYAVIGGKVDNEDSLDFASEALRELKEETGYDGKIELKLLSIFKNPVFEYHTFLGIVESEFETKPEPKHEWENDFFKWVTYEQLIDLKPKHFGLEYTLKEFSNKLKISLNF